MRKCKNCGKDISHRPSNALYCEGDICKNEYNNKKNKKNKSILSDGSLVYNNPKNGKNISIPPLPPKNYDLTIQKTFNDLANQSLSGVPFSNVAVGAINNTLRDDADPFYSIGILALGLIGAGIGYSWNKLNDKPTKEHSKNRLRNTIVGGVGGIVGFQYLYTVNVQFKNKKLEKSNEILRQKQEEQRLLYEIQVQQQDYEQTLQGFEEYTIVTGNEMLNYLPAAISYHGKFADFLGTELEPNFRVAIYGHSGSGKSHLMAKMIADFSHVGRCLVVNSEQGLGRNAHIIHHKYLPSADRNNVHIGDITDSNIIFNVLENNNYDFLFIDSIDSLGLTPNGEMALLKRLRKHYNLMGVFFITHTTKEGDIKGSLDKVFNSEVSIRVKLGVATHDEAVEPGRLKNRFNFKIDTINVFDDDERKGIENNLVEQKQIQLPAIPQIDERGRILNFSR